MMAIDLIQLRLPNGRACERLDLSGPGTRFNFRVDQWGIGSRIEISGDSG